MMLNHGNIRRFPKCTPIAGWFIVEKTSRMDDDWGYPVMTQETSM